MVVDLGNPVALGSERAKRQEKGSGHLSCIRSTLGKIPWKGAMSQDQAGRMVGEGSGGAVRWADDQLPGLEKSCLFVGYIP